MDQTNSFEATIDDLVARLNTIQKQQHEAKGYTIPAEVVHWSDKGRKFAYIDVGTSGAWLVEKATGEIFNIKAYGVPDYNKKKRADIGNIATVDAVLMHAKRYNYLR